MWDILMHCFTMFDSEILKKYVSHSYILGFTQTEISANLICKFIAQTIESFGVKLLELLVK